MSIGNILFNLPKQVKKTVRSIETIQRKLVKAQNALVFNQTAIKEDLLPNYTNIKTHDPATKQKAFTKEYRFMSGMCTNHFWHVECLTIHSTVFEISSFSDIFLISYALSIK